jgi:hypothetical protein
MTLDEAIVELRTCSVSNSYRSIHESLGVVLDSLDRLRLTETLLQQALKDAASACCELD